MYSMNDALLDLVGLLCENSTDIVNDIPHLTNLIYDKYKDEIEKQTKFYIGEVLRQGCVSYRSVMLRM